MPKTLKIILEDCGKYQNTRKFKVVKLVNLTEPYIGKTLFTEDVNILLKDGKTTVEIIPEKL